MSATLANWMIRRPGPAFALLLALVMAGAATVGTLRVSGLREVRDPSVSIALAEPGAAPSDMEVNVSRPVEDAAAALAGVRHVTTSIVEGRSVTVVQFQSDRDADRGFDAVKDALVRLRSRFPEDVADPVVRRGDVTGPPLVTYAVTAAGKTPEQLSALVDGVVTQALRAIPGVTGIERLGGVDRELQVVLDPDRLETMNVTASEVSRQLSEPGREVMATEPSDPRARSPVAMAGDGVHDVLVRLPEGGQIRLGDLAAIRSGTAPPEGSAHLAGRAAVGFAVFRAQRASDGEVADRVAGKLADIHATHPDLAFTLVDAPADVPLSRIDALVRVLGGWVGFATVVVLAVLRNVRAALITGAVLGLSTLATLWAMAVAGIPLNLGTALGLALATTILVDDTIVAVEDAERHRAMGRSPVRAAVESRAELGRSTIVSGLVIIAVLVLVSVAGRVESEALKGFGTAASVQISFSLLCNRFLTPVLAAHGLKRVTLSSGKREGTFVARTYSTCLGWCVRHRHVAVAVTLLSFILLLLCAKLLPRAVAPGQDTGRSLLAIELPPGSSAVAREAVIEDVVRRLRNRRDVESVAVGGGGDLLQVDGTRAASLIIRHRSAGGRTSTQRQSERSIRQDLAAIPDLRAWFDDGRGLSLTVAGPDAATVNRVASDLASQMRGLAILDDVASSSVPAAVEVRPRLRAGFAAGLGIAPDDVAETVRLGTVGTMLPSRGLLDEDGRTVPVRLEARSDLSGDEDPLGRLRVRLPGSEASVPLASLVDFVLQPEARGIVRQDRAYQATIRADVLDGATRADAWAAIEQLPALVRRPAGVGVRRSGDAEIENRNTERLKLVASLGFLVACLLLIAMFGNLVQPLAILSVVPLAISGLLASLLVTRQPFDPPAFLAFLLVGANALKSGVMMMSVAGWSVGSGQPLRAAMIDAGRTRARPVVMTALALVAGLAATLLSGGVGGDVGSSLAIGVTGGLLVSLPLLLFGLPAICLTMDDVRTAFARQAD